MRTINIQFDNEDFEALESIKGEQSWREFILSKAGITKWKDSKKKK